MRKKSDEKLQQIVTFINLQIHEKGYPPSVREICKAVGFKSTSTVHAYLKKLEDDGIIKKDPSKPRALRISEDKFVDVEGFVADQEIENIPILGRVAAGQPILATENVEDTFPIPVQYLGNKTCFMLTVKGDSMIEIGIHEGDYIIVQQQHTANNGDIVVALVEDEATVKTFYKEKDYIRLQPENLSYSPIIVKDVKILGKVIGLFRQF